jgi:UDP-N-acetylmuramate dehydrogenase
LGVKEMNKVIVDFLDMNGILYELNISAKTLVSFKIGGKVKIVIYPKNLKELTDTMGILKSSKSKYVFLGNGTNTFFSDEGYDGAVISTKKMNKISVNDTHITAQCGANLKDCCIVAFLNSLTGMEFAYGIPGNIGGCIYMNASAFGKDMSNIVLKTVVLNTETEELFTINKEEHLYGMKHSVFMDNKNYFIIETQLELRKGDKDKIYSAMEENMSKRNASQPLDIPSAGSVFKRPLNNYASKLIDDAGLKKTTVGDAEVSELHAGFIVNIGNAKSSDVLNLIQIIKNRIFDLYGILLEEEIIYIE